MVERGLKWIVGTAGRKLQRNSMFKCVGWAEALGCGLWAECGTRDPAVSWRRYQAW